MQLSRRTALQTGLLSLVGAGPLGKALTAAELPLALQALKPVCIEAAFAHQVSNNELCRLIRNNMKNSDKLPKLLYPIWYFVPDKVLSGHQSYRLEYISDDLLKHSNSNWKCIDFDRPVLRNKFSQLDYWKGQIGPRFDKYYHNIPLMNESWYSDGSIQNEFNYPHII